MIPGLYLHVPFCKRKCPYCDFYSVSAFELIPLWLKGLSLEVTKRLPYWDQEFDCLYLGGGSPSLLGSEDLQAVKKIIEPFKFSAKTEFTIECNPEDVSPEKVKIWLDAGVNRISLGVQSFNDRFLTESLNRTHLAKDNFYAVETILKAGLSLSLDLIFGHPGQSVDEWAGDLDKAALCGANHISAYILTPAPGTALADALKNGTSPRLPSEALISDLFLLTNEALKIRNFTRYEVSNFAKNGSTCRHNLKYWRRTSYLGLGPSAHSFDGTRRWGNLSSIRRWATALERSQTPVDFIEDITKEQAIMERIMLGLRLVEGFPVDLLKPTQNIDEFIKDGYLFLDGANIKPTEKGLLMSDFLARSLC